MSLWYELVLWGDPPLSSSGWTVGITMDAEVDAGANEDASEIEPVEGGRWARLGIEELVDKDGGLKVRVVFESTNSPLDDWGNTRGPGEALVVVEW